MITLEPIPSIGAPIATSIRARSWTWGSEAALRITVVPRVSAAAISAFSVAITDGSSIRKSHGRSHSAGASNRISVRSLRTAAPSSRKAQMCGQSGRRPITSPPGGGIVAEPNRASSGPASRNDARIRSARATSTVVLVTSEASILTSPGCPVHSTRAPSSAISSSIDSTSEIRGTLDSTTSSSVSRHAAMIGSAPFLLPAGVIVPDSGTPPSMTNFSRGIDLDRLGYADVLRPDSRVAAAVRSVGREGSGEESLASVIAMPEDSRAQAWTLLCEWTESDSLRRHMLAVEAAMRAYAPRFDGDVELWGLTGLLHDLDYERYPDLETGHPRYALTELEARGYPPELVRAVASHASYLGVSRGSPIEGALFGVDELCGFVLACAYVRPEGLVGMTPKSVKKKLKTPAFAAAVSREDITEGAADLGVDFEEHLTIVIAALTERRDELMPPAADARAAEA